MNSAWRGGSKAPSRDLLQCCPFKRCVEVASLTFAACFKSSPNRASPEQEPEWSPRMNPCQSSSQNPFHLEGTVDRRLWGLLVQVGRRLPGWGDVRIFHIPKSLICYAFLPCCPVATPLCPDSAYPEFCNNFAEFFSLLLLLLLFLLCCSFFVLCPFFVAPKRKSATLSCKVLERAGQPTVFSLGSAGEGERRRG